MSEDGVHACKNLTLANKFRRRIEGKMYIFKDFNSKWYIRMDWDIFPSIKSCPFCGEKLT